MANRTITIGTPIPAPDGPADRVPVTDGDDNYTMVERAEGLVADDDSRLSDARTPTSHASTHATAGSDPLTPGDVGAATQSDIDDRVPDPSAEMTGAVLGVSAGSAAWLPLGVVTVDDPSEIPAGYVGLVAVRDD